MDGEESCALLTSVFHLLLASTKITSGSSHHLKSLPKNISIWPSSQQSYCLCLAYITTDIISFTLSSFPPAHMHLVFEAMLSCWPSEQVSKFYDINRSSIWDTFGIQSFKKQNLTTWLSNISNLIVFMLKYLSPPLCVCVCVRKSIGSHWSQKSALDVFLQDSFTLF